MHVIFFVAYPFNFVIFGVFEIESFLSVSSQPQSFLEFWAFEI